MLEYQMDDDRCRIAIVGEMTIYNAAEMKKDLDIVLAEPKSIEMDLVAVTEIDSAGVQLLILMKKTCDGTGQAMKLVASNELVLDILETMGLGAYFDCSVEPLAG